MDTQPFHQNMYADRGGECGTYAGDTAISLHRLCHLLAECTAIQHRLLCLHQVIDNGCQLQFAMLSNL